MGNRNQDYLPPRGGANIIRRGRTSPKEKHPILSITQSEARRGGELRSEYIKAGQKKVKVCQSGSVNIECFTQKYYTQKCFA